MKLQHTLPRRQFHQQKRRQTQKRDPPVDQLAIRAEPEVHLQPAGDRLLERHRRQEDAGTRRPGGFGLLGLPDLGFLAGAAAVAEPDLAEAVVEVGGGGFRGRVGGGCFRVGGSSGEVKEGFGVVGFG